MQALQNEKIAIQTELYSTKQLNVQINDTKDKNHNSFVAIYLQNKTKATKSWNNSEQYLEQKVENLDLKIKHLKEQEKVYQEAEFHARNSKYHW